MRLFELGPPSLCRYGHRGQEDPIAETSPAKARAFASEPSPIPNRRDIAREGLSLRYTTLADSQIAETSPAALAIQPSPIPKSPRHRQ